MREILYRERYRGVIVWNLTKKRNSSGAEARRARPESEHLRIPAEHLRIVSEELWARAHRTMTTDRARYTDRFGAAASGREVKYLLAGLLTCSECGATLEARSGTHGTQGRVVHYGCCAYHRKGTSVCTNKLRQRREEGRSARRSEGPAPRPGGGP